MSETVYVPDGDSQSDTAVLLNEAAEKLDLRPEVVQRYTGPNPGWQVPEEVAKEAGLDTYDPDEDLNAEVEQARKDQPDLGTDESAGPGLRYIDTTAEPDYEAAREAVGNIDPGPQQTDDYDPQANLEPRTTVAGEDDQPKKATAKKSAAKKSTAKKSASKKAAAKKGS
jgi:hypothetical protein